MILTSRTPLRVSLFGGGTDYPAYFERRPGAVVGFAIDKYIYISALRLSSSVDYRYRLSYSKVELVDDVAQIQHPVVRVLLERYRCLDAMDFSIQADLPASAGLGSSSTFTVGFIALVSALQGIARTKLELAQEAIHAEQTLLGEAVGVQDQLHAAFGGINRFDFRNGAPFAMQPIAIAPAELRTLTAWMVLVYTGLKRRASEVVAEQLRSTAARAIDADLSRLVALADAGQRILETERGERLPRELARLLDESWQVKRRLSAKVSTGEIDALYARGCALGALGGKLCGAGGGGFLLMIVPPERRAAFAAALGARRCVDFAIDFAGATVTGAPGSPR